MEMVRNPNAMREAMRNQDLAMSQLENLPGGFNALRRMFEEVHEPMMEATQNIATGPTSANPSLNTPSSSTPASTAPTNSALPNPWGGGSTGTNPNPMGNAAGMGMGGNPNPFNPFNPMMGGGGLGLGSGMGGLGMDPANVAQMMQDPFTQQMVQQMLSDPNMLQRVRSLSFSLLILSLTSSIYYSSRR